TAAEGPSSSGPNSGLGLDTSVQNPGTWVDQTDAQPTMMSLTGLVDDYVPDGRVLTELMSNPPAATQSSAFLPLAGCYKQLYSSVGAFGSDTLAADTAEMESGSSSSDSSYQSFVTNLTSLGTQRDDLADTIKQELFDAEFNGVGLPADATDQTAQCQAILADASLLVSPGGQTPEAPLAILLPGVGLVVGLAAVGVRARRRSRRTRRAALA
ncbi:MAG TPA: hypothetical protein VMD59_11900, partial [Acidimicrobiales bacterium]|nr:hypothetical protein [Acidimicrobiales bacterium]